MSEKSLENFRIYYEIMEDESLEEFIAHKKDSGLKFHSMKLEKFTNDYFLHSNKIDGYVADCSDRILESIPLDVDYAGTYFILFELLNNVYKHSLFENAYVLCQSDEDIAEICIIDDGAGIANTLAENDFLSRMILRQYLWQ